MQTIEFLTTTHGTLLAFAGNYHYYKKQYNSYNGPDSIEKDHAEYHEEHSIQQIYQIVSFEVHV